MNSAEAVKTRGLETKIKRLEEDLAGVEVLTARFQESQGFLKDYMEENAVLEAKAKEDQATMAEKDTLIGNLQVEWMNRLQHYLLYLPFIH